ncbi:MAG TPA: alpha/beta hydrolase [Rhizomicrobium sp.]|nr:alpha/beta hydrolase [Rhizomicrobium sp.]
MRMPTRRNVIGGAAMMPLLAGAATIAKAQTGAAGRDPYSYVNPELLAGLKSFPAGEDFSARNLASIRAGDKNSSASDAPELQPRKAMVPGPGGNVPVLIFDPRPGAQNRPATVYIHGGGYVVGRADTNIRLAQDAAQATNSMVVSVDYTLAPEAHFPKSLEQNYAALSWVHKNAGQFGVDPARIAVLGDSAGGGHAAMLAIAARDRKEIPLAFQCLIYPMLDDRTGSTIHVPPYIGHFIWTEGSNRFGWSSLLGQPAGSPTVPPGSVPARVKDVSGLAPAFIGVGSIDLFCEEDIEYARRLIHAGVPTELLIVPGAYHGFDIVARDAPVTVEFRAAWQNALKRGLGVA